ncbi:MAG: hypothetical protein KGZ80_11420 [Methylomonas sp.]|nr:hypothetical protein [Methylomonas sp.]PPD21138.1 MAG: hypothetical protein CTY23_06520 [Methylomonas sp.]PPD27572.1 MAG: hypothetical protein CTY22_01550 [Methylomonas sp.]PPD39568.1 MAG: hypothetical protein CTY21_01545 [Methylomonas sp.]PPD55819.1 MAG: hypothetical protein CTY11_00815 [Methylomonas sp.]
MQPIRQIYQDAPDSIAIPEALRHQPVEIIIWPLAEPPTPAETDANGWPIGFFEATAGSWAGEPLVREPQDDYEQRLELE